MKPSEESAPRRWTLPGRVYSRMVRHVEDGYPDESCGLIFGPDDDLEVIPMENLQNEMHERDPQRFPRDARTAYYFDPLEFHRILEEQESRGRPMRSIYHSHPDHDAYFSQKDREDAAPPGLGPLFADAVYIVFAVRDARVVAAKGFAWDDAREDFTEVVISRATEAAD